MFEKYCCFLNSLLEYSGQNHNDTLKSTSFAKKLRKNWKEIIHKKSRINELLSTGKIQ